jgi:hypothetical protein
MAFGVPRSAFMLVVLAALFAAVFRISTAPHRIQDRRNTAYTVCLSSGGEWVTVDGHEICRKPEPAAKP